MLTRYKMRFYYDGLNKDICLILYLTHKNIKRRIMKFLGLKCFCE